MLCSKIKYTLSTETQLVTVTMNRKIAWESHVNLFAKIGLNNQWSWYLDKKSVYLTFRWPGIVTDSYNRNQIGELISRIYFWNETLHDSDSSSVHHQEFFTVRTTLVYVTACSQAVSKPVWHIPLLCVQWKTPDSGQRNFPKHVVFYSKNKFERNKCI